ncbi:hypothetical protein [Occallatibacter savannae]|uniref:hypothetical protein n=1 Tax=Occallatibacter savannae TaxID=1002691 RepID=UPI000D69380D|nr:hypothetical protein [Occallatibacter savannae]
MHDPKIDGDCIRWADSSLLQIEAGYDNFSILVQEGSGTKKIVTCAGYIGYQMIGFWDEVIVETARVLSDHPFLVECEKRLISLPANGAKDRSAVGNHLLDIALIDGCRFWVCAHHFRCDSAQ